MGTPISILPQGFNQATAAMQHVAGMMGARRAPGRRRKAKSKRASASGRRTKRASSKPARLVKGSRAAKAWMAKIRRKRR